MQNTQVLTQALIGLEKKYWKAMVESDLKTAVELTDFPCLVAGENGIRSVDRAEFEKMFNSHQGSITDFIFGANPEVRLLSPDCAVVAYKINSTINVNGKEQTIEAIDASTWVRRGDKWVCALHTETPLAQH